MKKKIKDDVLTVSFIFYAVFTITCGCLSWMFSKHRILIFQIWYQVTAVIWLVLAVMVLMLLTKLLKIKKLRNEINHRKE